MRVSNSFSAWGTHVCQHTLRAGLLSVRKVGFLQAQPEATDDIPCTSGARTRVKGAQVRRHGSTDLCSWDFSTPAPSPLFRVAPYVGLLFLMHIPFHCLSMVLLPPAATPNSVQLPPILAIFPHSPVSCLRIPSKSDLNWIIIFFCFCFNMDHYLCPLRNEEGPFSEG